MPKKRATQIKRARESARVARYNRQLGLLPGPVQVTLKTARQQPNPLRHVGEYLRFQRKKQPLATSYRKKPKSIIALGSAKNTVCERRQARKEVLFAKGKAGRIGVTYKGRRSPVKVDCKKSRH